MKPFIIKMLIFLLPFLLLIPVEMKLRNNSFKRKSEYIERNKEDIEIIFLGASQTWRAINPAFLDMKTAPLAHAGSDYEIDIRLLHHFTPELPNLKYVLFDISYGYLSRRRTENWAKNSLLAIHYGIDNYKGRRPLKDYLLITSNPRKYIDKFFGKNNRDIFNQYGFGTEVESSKFYKKKYDKTKIEKSYVPSTELGTDIIGKAKAFEINTQQLDETIEVCISKGWKVILYAAPCYYPYNQNMKNNFPEMLRRRKDYLNQYENTENIYIWNFEGTLEDDPKLYRDSWHMSPRGAEIHTKELNELFIELKEKE